MEQYTQYLMWVKSKDLIMNSFNRSMSSWEEQAFAEDALGPLGGFVWPPRSYSCSFCKREFRSAQALGGHMNVHRRERARLKQSHPNSPQSSTLSKSPEGAQNPSFISVASSHLSPSRVSPNTCGQESFFTSINERVLLGHDHEHNNVETGLFVGSLGLDFLAKSPNPVHIDDEDEIVANRKRQKTAVLSLMTNSMDEIDLELRLGDSPKFK